MQAFILFTICTPMHRMHSIIIDNHQFVYVSEFLIRCGTLAQVMHPRSESDYNATEAAEISRARIVQREPMPGHGAWKLNTQKRL